RRQAFDGAARYSHHRGGGGARLRVDHLARHHGAGRHAEGDRRLAQCRNQQGDQPPDVKEAWDKQGAVALVMTPAEFDAYLRKDIEKWAQVVKVSGIKAE